MLNNFSIATKLWLMSLFSSFFLVLTALLGFLSLDAISHAATKMGQGKDVVADILPPPLYLVESELIVKVLLYEDTNNSNQLLARLRELKNDYDSRNRYWESNQDISPGIKQLLLGEQRNQADLWWNELETRFLPAIESGDKQGAQNSTNKLDNYYAQHREEVDKTVKYFTVFADETLLQLGVVGHQATWFLVSASAIGAVISLFMAYLVIRKIHANLMIASKITEDIAGGDLTIVIPFSSHDEIGKLLLKISQMRDNLHNIIKEIRNQVTLLIRRSTEMQDVAESGEAFARSQSEAACSIAVSIEQLSVSLDLVDNNAGYAGRIAIESGLRAQESRNVIEATALEMQKISDVVLDASNNIRNLEQISTEITSIVNVIHDVAEQTNLLALNAAIEAARAGSHGRGFAVVADEVRKLAERTSVSSSEIKLMVEKIVEASKKSVVSMETGVKGVELGVQLSLDAGKSVLGIQEAQSQVTVSVDEITNAIKEQSVATRDITKRVEMVSLGAESLFKTVTKTKKSAEDLASQAESLDKLTSRFRL